jgi:tripartite-type tricarboxylate transporter receptor subunit TctC
MSPSCHRLLITPAGAILCAARDACHAFGVLALIACAAQASDWPTRPITAVVPYAAGGNTDTMARMVGERLTAALGQPVVVENVAGASGAIGAARVAHASPDGHTLLFASASQIIIAPLVQKTSYDPQKDFVPVSIYRGGGAAAIAMQSISTSNGPCQAETQMKLRAGGSDGKYRA